MFAVQCLNSKPNSKTALALTDFPFFTQHIKLILIRFDCILVFSYIDDMNVLGSYQPFRAIYDPNRHFVLDIYLISTMKPALLRTYLSHVTSQVKSLKSLS